MDKTKNTVLEKGLHQVGFQSSCVDLCLFYHNDVVFQVYINDCVLFSPSKKAIDQAIKDLRNPSKPRDRIFTQGDQGDTNEILGIQVKRDEDGTIHLSQPQLIDSILKDTHL